VTAHGCAVAMSTALAGAWNAAASFPPAAKDNTAVTPTRTWWCVDLNEVWKVKAALILPRGLLQPPAAPPIPDTCTSNFPVAVKAGSQFAPGNIIWYANNTCPPAIRAALQEMGFHFHSQSAAEDVISKFEQAARLPLLGFPVLIPAPTTQGEYRIWMYWTMSDWHNDGTCLDEGCMLAGEFLYANPRFTVVP
jgi:hypothetical protein